MYTSPLGANKERTDHGMRTIQLESVEKIAIKIRPKVEHEDITTCGRVMTNMSNQLLQEKQFNRMSLCFFSTFIEGSAALYYASDPNRRGH